MARGFPPKVEPWVPGVRAAAIFSVGGLTGAIVAPLLGNLLDRLGPRYLFPVGGGLILLSYLSSSFVSDFWQLFIFYGVLATVG